MNSNSNSKKKGLERGLILIGVIGVAVVIALYGQVFNRIVDSFSPSKSEIYGIWIEQNVAPYAAQRIHVQADSIIIDGRLVTTQYDFNGRYLSFYVGDQKMQYRMMNDERTEMRLVSKAAYNPTFHLSGKHQTNLR